MKKNDKSEKDPTQVSLRGVCTLIGVDTFCKFIKHNSIRSGGMILCNSLTNN